MNDRALNPEAVPLTLKLALDYHRSVDDVDWRFISPPMEQNSGLRTGKYRVGANDVLRDAQGKFAGIGSVRNLVCEPVNVITRSTQIVHRTGWPAGLWQLP